jgi:hypothetical protein
MPRLVLATVPIVLLAACGGGDDESSTGAGPADRAPGRSVGPPPDAGTRAGHGGDPARVVVPDRDATPPSAVVSLQGSGATTAAEAATPGRAPGGIVRLREPRVRATTVGTDEDSGVVRVRVSVKEEITCRGRSGRTARRARTRYVPPPQVERITARPGFRIPTRERRSVALPLSGGCPPGAMAVDVEGEVWGEAINGLGLEAVTPHIRFAWAR